MARPGQQRVDGAPVDLSYLNSNQTMDSARPHPAPAPAHRLGQRLAAAGRPAHADRHGPVRRRGADRARGRPAPRRRAARGPRAGAGHAPPPRPQRARGDDRRALGRAHRRLRARGRLRRDYAERARRGRPALLARADAPPRRAGDGARRHRGVLGVHPRRSRTPTTPMSCCRTASTIRAGGRDLRVVARPGHSTTDALLVDERERIAFVGDHLLAKISSNTEIYPALEPDRHAPARARRVPGEPAADGRDAARAACTPGTATTSPITPSSSAQRLADHERRCDRIVDALAAGEPPRSRSPPTCGPRRRSSSSPCSSSGRCSDTSICCSTPDASASR